MADEKVSAEKLAREELPPGADLLLRAFAPATPWIENSVGYRQWRALRGEIQQATDEGFTHREVGLDASHFEIESLLGEGNYSQIFAATIKATQQRVALKMIDKAKAKRYKKEDEVVIERWVLRTLRHPSIVDMYHAFQEEAALYLALEILPGGELWALSHKVGLPPSLATFYAAQVRRAPKVDRTRSTRMPSRPAERARALNHARSRPADRCSRCSSSSTSATSCTATSSRRTCSSRATAT